MPDTILNQTIEGRRPSRSGTKERTSARAMAAAGYSASQPMLDAIQMNSLWADLERATMDYREHDEQRTGKAYGDALDRLVDARTIEPIGIANKLRALFPYFGISRAEQEGGEVSGDVPRRAIMGIIRDLDAAGDTALRSGGGMPPPPAARRHTVVGRQSTRSLLRALGQAALPFVDDKGDDMRVGVTPLDIYKAIAPLVAGCTVAEAAALLDVVRNAVNTSGARRSTAFSEALWVLEGFVAYARASGPECARARASVLTASLDDDGVFGTVTQAAAASMVQDDVGRLIEGRSFEGETFGDFLQGHKNRTSWMLSYLESERHGMTLSDIQAAMGWGESPPISA